MVAIMDFGKRQGIQTYHVTGSKDELNKILESVRTAGGQFANTPKIKHVHRGQYILYLKLKLELVGVTGNEQRNKISGKNDG